MAVRPPTHESGTFQIQNVRQRVWPTETSRRIASRSKITKLDGTEVNYSEVLSRGKVFSPAITFRNHRVLTTDQASTYPKDTLVISFVENPEVQDQKNREENN